MRLLFFAGSTREGSYNKKLARLAQHIATANGIEGGVRRPQGLSDAARSTATSKRTRDRPQKAREFKALLAEYPGVFIASPEYNSSITPLLKNTSTG